MLTESDCSRRNWQELHQKGYSLTANYVFINVNPYATLYILDFVLFKYFKTANNIFGLSLESREMVMVRFRDLVKIKDRKKGLVKARIRRRVRLAQV